MPTEPPQSAPTGVTPTSVIVPAHDEELVIARCLDALLADATPGEFHVVVVENGSRDRTAEVAQDALTRHASPGTVLRLGSASKAIALRAGDEAAPTYPRIYLDADVSLSTGAARELVALLDDPEPRVAAPALTVDASRSSWPVRGYYATWTRLPYVGDGVIGSGVYAVNAAGGARLGTLPDLVNDDGYVRRRFAPEERRAGTHTFTVIAPRTVAPLVRRRARIASGNVELDKAEIDGGSPQVRVGDVVALVRSRRVGPVDALCFVAVTVAARALGRYRRQRGRGGEWSTDLSSREAA